MNAVYLRSIGLGASAGLRTFTPGSMLALTAKPGAGRRGVVPLALLALGELVGDKLPVTPSRLIPPSLAARAVSGAFVGAGAARRFDGSRVVCAVLGGLAAVGSAYVGANVRSRAAAAHLPDFVVAAVEDAVALSTAYAFAR